MVYPCQNEKKYTVTRVVTCLVTRSSYGNALLYDLPMFVELEKFHYASVNPNFNQIEHITTHHKTHSQASPLASKYAIISEFCLH